MENHNKLWSDKDVRTLTIMAKNGASAESIAAYLGRTQGAVEWKLYDAKIRRPKKQKPSIKYTHYVKPSNEVSILWGLFKWTKS